MESFVLEGTLKATWSNAEKLAVNIVEYAFYSIVQPQNNPQMHCSKAHL